MFADAHYDFLTQVYVNKDKIDLLKKFCEEIYYRERVDYGILNLYFMSEKEMFKELGISNLELDVPKMLNIVINIIKNYNLLPKSQNFIFSIEGCDYLKISQLEEIYKLGVRSILPVWNEVNIYGAGNRGHDNQGLTESGIQLIKKCVELGIIIDLSHANEKTFFDIIRLLKILKGKGKRVNVIVSHSNAKDLFVNRCTENTLFMRRNITDEQMIAIKELDGAIGIVLHKLMLKPVTNKDKIKTEKNCYSTLLIEHIKHVVKLIGVNNVMIATDDMGFDNNKFSSYLNMFDYKDVKKRLEKLLICYFNKEEVSKLMYKNFCDKIINR